MISVLITGVNGLLGSYLTSYLLSNGYRVIGIGKGENRLSIPANDNFRYHDIDITHDFKLQQLMARERPDVVVHAAAITQVDECQLNQETCEEVNVRGTATVLLNAEEFCGHFIFISTDFVFDGDKGNYAEDDHLNPVNWYGFTKVQAESIVESSEMNWSIVRTCLVYGLQPEGARNNIVTWIKDSLEQDKAINVLSDQVRTATYAGDLAKGIELIIRKKATGIFHISGEEVLTAYEMAIKTADFLGLDAKLIKKTDVSFFNQPAKRPMKTGFDISKARSELGFEPMSFEKGLASMFSTKDENNPDRV